MQFFNKINIISIINNNKYDIYYINYKKKREKKNK